MMAVTISSCSKDDEPTNPNNPSTSNPNKPVKDPDHTITVNLLSGQSWREATTLGNHVQVYINSAYNIYAEEAYIVDLGPVAGLGNITSAPESGWKKETAAIVGHGYAIKSSYSYGDIARLYIEKEMVSTSNSVMGYTVKYQCPMDNQFTLDSGSLRVNTPGKEERIKINSGTGITVKSKPNWVNVTISNGFVNVTALENNGEWREEIITLSNSVNYQTVRVYQN